MAVDQSILVSVRANITGLTRGLNRATSQITGMGRTVNSLTSNMSGLSERAQGMARDLREAFRTPRTTMNEHRESLIEVQHGYLELARNSEEYAGKTGDLMSALQELGTTERKVAKSMISDNIAVRTTFLSSIGAILGASTQSSNIASNLERINNPVYNVNQGLLSISDGLEQIARNGTPAVLALQQLGPTATMAQLQSQITLISAGIMRMQMVAMAAAVASGVLYAALFKAATGPDPSEVYRRQTELLVNYEDEVRRRTQGIMEAWNIFEKVEIKGPNPNTLIQNLADQVTTLQGWRMNLDKILSRTGDSVFTEYLQELGPTAAGEIAVLSQMTDSELSKYVQLWREKTIHARKEAEDQLTLLKENTDKKVKELQDSLKPLGLALEPMKAAWAEAFKPMVEVFAMVAVPIVNFITKIGEMITKFNEAHPTLAKMIQGFLMLLPILTLLLAPLAVGIGLFGGLSAAFNAVWLLIAPLVTGLATMMGTVILVAGVIVGLVSAFIYAWNNIEGFRNFITTAMETIKNAFMIAFNFVKDIVISVMSEVSSFLSGVLGDIKAFWEENGSAIMTIVKTYFTLIGAYISVVMSAIKAVFQIAWPIIVGVIKVAWALIQSVISTAINLVLGIISATMKVLQGDWKGAWESIKSTAKTIMDNIVGYFKGIDLVQIGKNIVQGLANGMASVVGTVKKKVQEIAALIPSGVKKFLGIHSPSRVMMELGVNTGEGFQLGLKDQLAKIKAASLDMASAAVPSLAYSTPGVSGHAVSMAERSLAASASSSSSQKTTIEIPLYLNGSEIARATYDDLDRLMAGDFSMRSRMGGLRG
jgi:phage-related protein